MVGLEEEILHILFIADDDGLADLYRLKLELDGYRVTVVDRQQLPLPYEPFPNLVFMDLRAVDDETLSLLSDLRSRLTAGVPLVLLTQYTETELRHRGVSLGARDSLVRVPRPPAKTRRQGTLVSDAVRGWARRPTS